MSDAQKTTKGVREAPAASQRYVVVRTTRGWQIRDLNAGFLRGGLARQATLVHAFGSKEAAEDEARHMNREGRGSL